jgi:hypothetical protein
MGVSTRRSTSASRKQEHLSLGKGEKKELKLSNDELRAGILPKFLCLTTGTMMLPFTLQRCWRIDTWQANFLSWWCALTYAVSILYWHDAREGWRLNLDNIFAKLSFCVVAYFAVVYGQDFNSAVFGWPVCVCIVLLYGSSVRHFNDRSRLWIIPHGLMHLCVGFNMGICMWTLHRHMVNDAQMDVCGLGVLDNLFVATGNLFKEFGLNKLLG